MAPPIPSFSSLPLKKDGPRGNAWGLFGPTDELGMLNRLTPSTTLAAAAEIVHGIRISTDQALDKPTAPCFNRQVLHQHIHHKSPRTINDDILTLNTQSSTQWDGFRHFGYQDHQIYFNGCKQDEIHNSTRNGIHVWAENGGIVGRGVLLDYYAWAQAQKILLSPLEMQVIPLSSLLAVADYQNTTFQPGDILFVRTGFLAAHSALSPDAGLAYAAQADVPSIGVEACEEMLKWLWESGFSAVAGDQPAFEALPFQSKKFWLHEWLLAGWGMPIGELFDLEQLAEECGKLKKWSFFFSSMPLKVGPLGILGGDGC
ncbi:hypothetical protein LAWI1_G002413 [Lachnellula willkommii]|uniref:Cyclase n=1 Tax=Lachnellula willkommii TaxID=215461 RepID=A0A559ME78_9HELO|nr:hypothetical protein LAWI1_G002413 [Lachnellula willkommii]